MKARDWADDWKEEMERSEKSAAVASRGGERKREVIGKREI